MTEALIEVLKQEDAWGIKHRIAVTALGTLGNAKSIPVLTNIAATHHWHRVREAAATALGRFRESEAEATLIQLLEDPDYAVQCAAATALNTARSSKASGALCKAMAQDDSWGLLQSAAISSLRKLKDPSTMPALVAMLKKPGNSTVIIDGILDALTGMGRDAVGPLLSVLHAVDEITQSAITRTLHHLQADRLAAVFPDALLGDEDALEQILAMAKDHEVRGLSVIFHAWRDLEDASSATKTMRRKRFLKTLHYAYDMTANCYQDLVCRQDLTRFAPLTFDVLSYHACRTCGETYYAEKAETVVAMLDESAPLLSTTAQGRFLVNGLQQAQLFDFDEVVVGNATNEAVVRFCMMVGNDADPLRTGRRVPCRVLNPDALAMNTLRILEKTFEV